MAKKKRVKSDKAPIIPISGKQEADRLLRQMGDLQAANNQDKISAKLKIDKIKAALADTTGSRNIEIDQIHRSLEAFAAGNQKQLFQSRRSIKLNHGTIGWHKSTSISIKKNTLDLIKEVFSRAKAKTLINIKETVSKDALAKLTDEQLASVGAKRKSKDAFFAEPSEQDSPDYTK